MTAERKKFLLTLFLTFLVLMALLFAYAWFTRKKVVPPKPVAVCGGTVKT